MPRRFTILLPTMSEDTGTPVAQLQWAVTGYMLVAPAVIVTSGALSDGRVLARSQIRRRVVRTRYEHHRDHAP
jgi:hypothetical protein